ncbi:putative L-type lectin-domain containing receptor kinase S.5 [Hibiscus syriacus]|uniref:L-type lectin-domain containing receptor kinase S.5 n=1 Tax=Hibiscus syriacus TaxID=106335 RepID=A0A6A3CH18_HIBSY|nr:probable L-type lectin-domain containing receptor kinase S.5 [Hibiscus syriacus]KAE8726608.1 putative L-type lectin-domain containing receptor kinase S.5 [Hibiscus syriacus]
MATLPALNLLPILIVLSCIKVECFDFNFTDFQEENRKDLLLSENSTIFRNALQITPDLNGDVKDTPGRAYYGKKFRLWNRKKGRLASFNTTFVINISNKNSPEVGEGLAFVLSADADVPNDSFGQWLGLVNATTNGTSRAGIVGVEFDTRKSYEQEPDGNHVGLDINSCYSIEQRSLSGYGVNLSVGVDVLAVVQYDGKNMTVFVSSRNQTPRSPVPVFSVPINLSRFLPETVHVGFSASTGEFQELNCVRAWEFHGEDIDEDSNLLRVWIFIPILALGLVLGLGFFIHWRRRTRKDDPEKGFQNIEDHIKSSTAPRRFKLRELKRATNNFNQKNKLGKGGFGTVYKGIWKEQEIAVKRVSKKSHQGSQEFIAEVTTIGNLNHKNLVKLIGWCYENKELLLVYEYMLNGSLDKFIFYDEKTGKNDEPRQPNLSWETRLIIIQGVAEALDYLHNGCEKRVLHRDVKCSNIMLDSEFNARLGDFGLARTIQQREKTHHSTIEIAGTPGYMAPETFLISRAMVETDVYSYGVLLIEVVCGRKLGNQSELNNYNNSIVNWLWEYYRKGKITYAVDSNLKGDFVEKEVESALILGLACCHPNPHLRPSMKHVLAVLTGEADPPQVPLERPSFVWPALPPAFSHSDYSLTSTQFSTFSEVDGR